MCGVFFFSVPETPWCSPIKVKHGYANCRTPQGEYYKNVLGTRCDIRCQKGYELHGPHQLICQSSKRWSGKVLCKRKCSPNICVWLVLQIQTINPYLPLKLIFGLLLFFCSFNGWQCAWICRLVCCWGSHRGTWHDRHVSGINTLGR